MQSLNKRQMMFAISVTLTAYAFAISGCGSKHSPDQASKAANAADVQSLQGSWAADPVSPKAGQSNLHMLTITKKSMKLRTVCIIDGKDGAAPVAATAEIQNDFTVDSKNIKFKVDAAFKSADAPTDCVASLKQGNIKFSIDADKLTLSLNASGTTDTTDTNKTGLVFKKATADQIQSIEKDLKAKIPGAAAAVASKDGSTPANGVIDEATKAKITKQDGVNADLLAGMWVSQSNDDKVAADAIGKELSKTNFDVINFSKTKSNKFNERLACYYKLIQNSDKVIDPKIDAKITKSVLLKINTLNLPETPGDDSEKMTDVDTNGILFEAVLDAPSPSIKIKKEIGGVKQGSALGDDFIKLTPAQKDLTNCQLSYKQDQRIAFSIDGSNLTLTDDVNGVRKFHKFNKDIDGGIISAVKNTQDKQKAKPEDTSKTDALPAPDKSAPPAPAAAVAPVAAPAPTVVSPAAVVAPAAAPTTTAVTPPAVDQASQNAAKATFAAAEETRKQLAQKDAANPDRKTILDDDDTDVADPAAAASTQAKTAAPAPAAAAGAPSAKASNDKQAVAPRDLH